MFFDLSIEEHQVKFKEQCNKHYTDKACVELTKKQSNRTLQQNKYLHVVFSLIGLEFGENKEAVKHILKVRRSDIFKVDVKGCKVPYFRSTADLDKDEMKEFIDWIIEYMAINHNVRIPTVEEYLQHQHNIDSEIAKNEKYLV